jgi:hypothetical protein
VLLLLPEEATERVKVVLAVVAPDVPVTVIVKAPVVAVLLAVSVSTLELVVDVGLNEAVTPLGRPDTVNATLPVNVPVSFTVIVSVPLAPCLTLSEDADGVRLNPDVDPLTVMANAWVLLHELVLVYVAVYVLTPVLSGMLLI